MASNAEKYRMSIMNQSINKAVNTLEIPVKEKHVRSTIIGTFHEKGAGTFWVVALRLPLQDNRIAAWKFCHVLHKVLREGHHNCLQQSLRHRDMLTNLGKLWVYLKESYGKLIHLYSKLLVTKMTFHERNPQIPGNLQLTGEELEAIAENDINNYFQLSVEIFDYMDDILALQGAILDLFDNNRPSSMTSSGQCRLAPLIPCIQDSNQLYDFSVKLLFKLHSKLSTDTLTGHRDRFLKQFKLLKKVYDVTHNMQYFQNLITIPSLPDNPPNFLIQSELTMYRTPVVVLPPEEQFDLTQDSIGNLIDTSEFQTSPETPSDSVDSGQMSDLIIQRDSLIDNLQTEISRLRNERENSSSEYRATVESLNDQIGTLQSQLSAVKIKLECEKEQFDLLKRQLPEPSAPNIEKELEDAIEREKAAEERYQKLKPVYMQLREEHINLIRQKAETEKQIGSCKKQLNEQEMLSKDMESTINRLTHELSRLEEVHVQKAEAARTEADVAKLDAENQSQRHQIEVSSLTRELDATVAKLQQLEQELLKQKEESNKDNINLTEKFERNIIDLNKNIIEINMENKMLNQKINDLLSERELDVEKSAEEVRRLIAECDEVKADRERLKNELSDLEITCKNEMEASIDRLNAELDNLRSEHENVVQNTSRDKLNSDECINRQLQEIEALKAANNDMVLDFEKRFGDLNNNYDESKNDLENLKSQYDELLNDKTSVDEKLERYSKEKLILESDLQDLLQQKIALEESSDQLRSDCKAKEELLLKEQQNVMTVLWSLMKCGVRSAHDIIKGTLEELDNPAISSLHCGPDYFRSFLPITNEALTNLEQSLGEFERNKRPSENIALQIVKVAHLFNTIVIQGVATSNTAKDIVFGENTAVECRNLANTVNACICYVQLFDMNFESVGGKKSSDYIAEIKSSLNKVAEFIGLVGGQDNLGASDSIENELTDMDKAIEEAANRIEEMLRASRAADSGLKLEVNEKILDACTSLMAAVKELVKKSRSLQAEIVSQGRGTNTDKEFYKRNHQWTEGLISAAKSVALGAKYLLTSADRLITGDGKLEQVMVASQEIAASTAQLVVASRVRASRGSTRLDALSVASRAVSSATGAVIATAKSCAQLVEESEDLDMSGMSLQAGRRKEMDSRVRVLELEQALTNERLKLAALRRTNYRLAETEAEDKT